MAACDPLTEDQIVEMLESRAFGSGNRARNQALFVLECATGGRVGEILGLRLRDVLDACGRLRDRVTFTRTKNGCPRTVAIVNPICRPFLLAWLLELRDLGYCLRTDPLFPSRVTGRALSSTRIYQIYTTAARQLGFDGTIGTHSCRKTWARDVYRHYHARQIAGEMIDPLLKLQEAGGWKTIDAARRYIAFMLGDTTESQRALYPKLQAKYAGVKKITKATETTKKTNEKGTA